MDFSKEKLPEVYMRDGKECYLDPVRKRLIFVTPEETVRQLVISWLISKLHVPADMIRVEEYLAHYGVKTKKRADIIIERFSKEDHLLRPLAVIECKAPGVLLGMRTADQMMEYADIIGADYMMMTDGTEAFCYYYNEPDREYIQIESLPDYKDQMRGEYTYLPEVELPDRLTIKEIQDEGHWQDYIGEDMGCDTPEPILKAAVNLWECFLYPEHKLPEGQNQIFKLVKDYGVRLLDYGNASGGKY